MNSVEFPMLVEWFGGRIDSIPGAVAYIRISFHMIHPLELENTRRNHNVTSSFP